MIKLSETTNATWRTDIGNIIIRYSGKSENDLPIESINANILKDDSSIGTANIDRDGSTGISLRKGLTTEERVSIVTSLIQDTDSIFNPKTTE
ncbi:MAG: hypothetical protein LUH63_07180 [Parabacteroides sp.]|nr:hypothetical protein [Parabacteroides sp.]